MNYDSKAPYNDEIALFELIATLWAKKFWVAASAGVFGILGIVFGSVTTPIYKATMHLRPVGKEFNYVFNPAEIASFEALRVPYFSNEDAFTQTLNNIKFFREVKGFINSRQEETFKKQSEFDAATFDRAVSDLISESLEVSLNEAGTRAVVSYRATDAVEASNFLSGLVTWSQDRVSQRRKRAVLAAIDQRLALNQIGLEVLMGQIQREPKVFQEVVEEAETLISELIMGGRDIGVGNRPSIGKMSGSENTFYFIEGGKRSQNYAGLVLNSGLVTAMELQQIGEENLRLNALREMVTNQASMETVFIDKPPVAAKRPVAPKRAVIALLSAIFGAILGILFVVFKNEYRKRAA